MANPTNTIQRNRNLADTLAVPVGDGTLDSVVGVQKVDAAGKAAPASQAFRLACQLNLNAYDDAWKRVVELYYQHAKVWGVDDLAALGALGSDDNLIADALGFTSSAPQLYRCVSVDGPSASTWAVALPSPPDPDLASVLAEGNVTGGTDIEITDGDAIVGELGGSLSFDSGGDAVLSGDLGIAGYPSVATSLGAAISGSTFTNVQTFSTPGTFVGGWTKPAAGTLAIIVATGAGGGGGGGSDNATTGARSGGTGGGGGAKHVRVIPLSLLGATETVTVGSGGAGGSGGNGGNGGPSVFGDWVFAGGGGGGRLGVASTNSRQGGGGGGTGANGGTGDAVLSRNEGGPGFTTIESTSLPMGASGGTGCRGGFSGTLPAHAEWGGGGGGGNRGSAGNSHPGGTSLYGGGGGGAGGSYVSGSRIPGAGGISGLIQEGGGGGLAGSNNASTPSAGSAGDAATSAMVSGSGGGGGGGAINTDTTPVDGRNGGAGGAPGGGGGGGGCSSNGGTPGSGGSGGAGSVIVYVV